MKTETTRVESTETETRTEATETTTIEWASPDFTEQSACAEICAYVFSA
jgi:hypothetical protein